MNRSCIGRVVSVLVNHDSVSISSITEAVFFIFRFIAERGNTGQVTHVDKIDVAFQLQSVAGVKKPKQSLVSPESALQLMAPKPRCGFISYSLFILKLLLAAC